MIELVQSVDVLCSLQKLVFSVVVTISFGLLGQLVPVLLKDMF